MMSEATYNQPRRVQRLHVRRTCRRGRPRARHPWQGAVVALALAPMLLVHIACSRADAAPGGNDGLVVVRGTFAPRLLLTGELVAESAIRFVTPNANIWPVQIQWLEEDGAEVAAGDPVVEFDNSRLTSNLEQVRDAVRTAEDTMASTRAQVAATLEEARFALADAEARLAKTRIDAEVPAELFSARDFEQRQLDFRRAKLEHAEAEQKLQAAEEAGTADIKLKEVELSKAQLNVRVNERRLEMLSVRAPVAGVFLRHENGQEGARPFRSGDSTYPGNVVASLPDLATLMIDGSLYDVDDGSIEPGQTVHAVLDAYPERSYSGRIRSVDALAELPSARATRRVFRVQIDLDQVDTERMRPGMSVKVEVQAAAIEDALLVPRQAIDFLAAVPEVHLADGGRAAVSLGPCGAHVCVAEAGVDAGQRLRAVARGERGTLATEGPSARAPEDRGR